MSQPLSSDQHRLQQLAQELAEPLPHPDAAALEQLTGLVSSWALHHFATLPQQTLGLGGTRTEMEALLREPPPEQGSDFERVLAEFRDRVMPHAVRVNHPRFVAFVPGAPTFVSVLGDWLCAAANCFAGVWAEAAGPTEVELVVLDWFKEFLGCPAQAQGLLTGGGSEATLTALVAARGRLSFEERSRAVLYESEQRHWSVDRAALVIGLRPEQVRPLTTSADGRLEADTLARAVVEDRQTGKVPWAVVANAGSTHTGAVDPLRALAEVCRQDGLWLHVDAAYGWSAVLTPEGKALLAGIELADSITLDPHKWFAQTFEAGCVLLREGRLLEQTFTLRPDYMEDVAPAGDEVNFADLGLALTRRFRALKIWLSVKVLGVGWFRALVQHCCGLAEFSELQLRRAPVFEVLSPRSLSIVCFRYVPAGFAPRTSADEEELDRLNLEVLNDVRFSERAFLSSTRLRGRLALRLCFVNWRTTAGDVEEILRLLAESGGRLSG